MVDVLKVFDTPEKKCVRSEGYNFNFNKIDGFFARWGKTLEDDPEYSMWGNEILDIEVSTKTRLYAIYLGIKARCYNKKYRGYSNYGNRGIYMCDEWLNNFVAFRNWASVSGYQDTLCIDTGG